MSTTVIVDSRELHVIPSVKTVFKDEVDFVVSQIQIGDYLIVRDYETENMKVCACFERKTLKDFAASFRDRYADQKRKMIEFRESTRCQLFYFVEGVAFPPLDRKIGKVPYRCILGAMTAMMVRDKIFVVQTKSIEHTVHRLKDFATIFRKDEEKITEFRPEAVDELPTISEMPKPGRKNDAELIVQIWSSLRGLSVAFATAIAERVAIRDFFGDGFTLRDIDELKTKKGRKLGRDARGSLKGLKRGVKEKEIKFLGGFPGISETTAKNMLRGHSLKDVSNMATDELSELLIVRGGREVPLGDSKAEKISYLFSLSPRRG